MLPTIALGPILRIDLDRSVPFMTMLVWVYTGYLSSGVTVLETGFSSLLYMLTFIYILPDLLPFRQLSATKDFLFVAPLFFVAIIGAWVGEAMLPLDEGEGTTKRKAVVWQ